MPSVSGMVSTPESVAPTPFTNCRYSGAMIATPTSTKPISTWLVTPITNTGSRNSRGGIEGFGRACLAAHEQREPHHGDRTQPEDLPGEPRIRRAAEARRGARARSPT